MLEKPNDQAWGPKCKRDGWDYGPSEVVETVPDQTQTEAGSRFRGVWEQEVSLYSASQITLCWLLSEDEGQSEKGLSLVRLLSALSTASGM